LHERERQAASWGSPGRPWESSGRVYIYTNSRSTAPAAVMLYLLKDFRDFFKDVVDFLKDFVDFHMDVMISLKDFTDFLKDSLGP